MEEMKVNKCPACGGDGAYPKCPACGKVSYAPPEIPQERKPNLVPIPKWYLTNQWDTKKIIYNENPGRTKTLELLDKIIKEGEPPDFSAMFLLPADSGKRIAVYTLIQKYQQRGYSVAPVMDMTSLNVLLNRNRYEDQQLLLDLFSCDMAVLYSTSFVTRKNSAKIFEGIAGARALKGKPTLFFGAHSFKELSSWGTTLDINLNQAKIDKLAHPYIFDGVAERILDGQRTADTGAGTEEQ
jgi:hypothetical protein